MEFTIFEDVEGNRIDALDKEMATLRLLYDKVSMTPEFDEHTFVGQLAEACASPECYGGKQLDLEGRIGYIARQRLAKEDVKDMDEFEALSMLRTQFYATLHDARAQHTKTGWQQMLAIRQQAQSGQQRLAYNSSLALMQEVDRRLRFLAERQDLGMLNVLCIADYLAWTDPHCKLLMQSLRFVGGAYQADPGTVTSLDEPSSVGNLSVGFVRQAHAPAMSYVEILDMVIDVTGDIAGALQRMSADQLDETYGRLVLEALVNLACEQFYSVHNCIAQSEGRGLLSCCLLLPYVHYPSLAKALATTRPGAATMDAFLRGWETEASVHNRYNHAGRHMRADAVHACNAMVFSALHNQCYVLTHARDLSLHFTDGPGGASIGTLTRTTFQAADPAKARRFFADLDYDADHLFSVVSTQPGTVWLKSGTAQSLSAPYASARKRGGLVSDTLTAVLQYVLSHGDGVTVASDHDILPGTFTVRPHVFHKCLLRSSAVPVDPPFLGCDPDSVLGINDVQYFLASLFDPRTSSFSLTQLRKYVQSHFRACLTDFWFMRPMATSLENLDLAMNPTLAHLSLSPSDLSKAASTKARALAKGNGGGGKQEEASVGSARPEYKRGSARVPVLTGRQLRML